MITLKLFKVGKVKFKLSIDDILITGLNQPVFEYLEISSFTL